MDWGQEHDCAASGAGVGGVTLLGVAESDIAPSGLGLCDLGWVRHFHFPDEIYVFTLNQHDFSTKTSDLAGQEDDLT